MISALLRYAAKAWKMPLPELKKAVLRKLQAFLRDRATSYLQSHTAGVLHIGGHKGEEAAAYAQRGRKVIWVEADPELFEKLKIAIGKFPGQHAFCALLGDRNEEVDFYVSSNDAQSSSVLEFGPYAVSEKSLWPDLNLFTKKVVKLRMLLLDDLLSQNATALSDYDYWVVDVQGAEGLVLAGAKNSIAHCSVMEIEASTVEVYKGGILFDEIKSLLQRSGLHPLLEPHMFREYRDAGVSWQHGDLIFFHEKFFKSTYFSVIVKLLWRLG